MKRNTLLTKALAAILLSSAVISGCSSTSSSTTATTAASTTAAAETTAAAAASGSITAGTYTASEKGFASDVTVTMTIEADGSISAVDVDASGETDTIGQVAAPKLADAIVENQSIGVDAVTGATFTSTAVLTAAENCLTQAGADAESYKVAVEKNGVDETLDYDVVIAGAGGSGCSAALAASENGAKVLLVEKTGAIGGNSMLASGMFAVESSLQAEAGIEPTSTPQFRTSSSSTTTSATVR